MTNLFDATFRQPLEKTGEGAHTTRFGRRANRIVNLTLTSQTRGQTGAKAPAAWTLQDLSCTTNRGAQVA
jgi:hypothetical protein